MNDEDDARSVSSDDEPDYDYHKDKFFIENIGALVRSDVPSDKEFLDLMVINAAQTNKAGVYFRLISSGYQLQVLNAKGQTAMHVAFYYNSYAFLEYVIDHNCEVEDEHVNRRDCNGLTHLHIACSYFSEASDKLAEIYLKNGADVNVCFELDPQAERSGFTPLHMSIEGRLDLVKLLLEYGADVDARDTCGRTPLHLASGSRGKHHDELDDLKSLKLMALLIDSGSDVNAKDSQGNTPLHSVLLADYDETVSYAEGLYLKCKLLVDRRADVTLSDNAGDTALHHLVMNLKYLRCRPELSAPCFDDFFHVKIIDEMFASRYRLDVNAKNNAGETPLQIAVSMLSLDVISNLVGRRADVSDVTLSRDGRHCFYNSTCHPNFETVKRAMSVVDLLLKKGFKFTLSDKLGFMRFLLQDVSGNVCLNLLHGYTAALEAFLDNLLNFGSCAQVHRVYKQMALVLLSKGKTHFKNKIDRYAERLFRYRQNAGIYVDRQVGIDDKMLLENEGEKYYLHLPKLLRKLKNDIAVMKSTFIKDNLSIYDVMHKHPHKIYHYIDNVDFKELTCKFSVYKSIVEGHVTKSIVRNYIENLTNDYMKIVVFRSLPDVCCRMIFLHLSNEDILNVCSAATYYEVLIDMGTT